MTLTLSNCQKKYAVESASIDSLILKNSKAMDYLKIDLITINERKNEMKGQIAVLQKIKPDSSVLEFVMNLDKYKGIFTVYKRFIENYDDIFSRVRLNEKQLSSLKNSLVDEKISGFDFKLVMQKEKELVESNLNNAETFAGRIAQLEPEYQRLSVYFDQHIAGLLKLFPELKDELHSMSK